MSEKKEDLLPVPVLPARGARAGVRSDVSRAKDGSYNPVGTGSAWSHNFLNQKPWHPLNFRNQIRKYEAEQKAISDHKAKEQAMAEWQSEQEKHATLALLSPEEAKRQKDRASISFMYQKPPGLEAALARDREREEKQQREAAAAAAASGTDQQQQLAAAGENPPLPTTQQQQQQQLLQQQEALRQRQQQLDRLREDPFAAILAARSALQQNEKFVLKSVEGAYGGTVPGSENQLLLDESEQQQGAAAAAGDIDDAEALLASLDPDERQAVLAALDRKRRRADKAERLKQAQELLRAAGINPAEVDDGKKRNKRSKDKHRKYKKHKSKERHKKHKKERRIHPTSRSGSSTDDTQSSGSSD